MVTILVFYESLANFAYVIVLNAGGYRDKTRHLMNYEIFFRQDCFLNWGQREIFGERETRIVRSRRNARRVGSLRRKRHALVVKLDSFIHVRLVI